ncbi:hypothetical protein [Mycolicibacterium sp. 120270]|uniref:hypothetical protein n=1 Tax=Mycolicibacterium sp. 120270 TaxID=3090600 RepID=UPI00299D99CC|nr:hypothetical protein [Mycolicibacterium sp. 120270]MDX1883376.1 hypothetical protein [Mycolicibacterium sp. 120270]
MNNYYGPQHSQYAQPQVYYAPQPMYAPAPVAPQNSGSGMKLAAGALALLAIGIAAFAIVAGMKKSETTTTAQSTPSTVFNIPSEINIPSLTDDSPSTSPVVVNNPAPRVITIPGQAPVQQAPAPQQQAPAPQQAPVPQQQAPAQQGNNNEQAAEEQAAKDAAAQKAAEEQAAKDAAAEKAAKEKAATKQALLDQAAALEAQAAQFQNSGNPALQAQAGPLLAQAAQLKAQAAAL